MTWYDNATLMTFRLGPWNAHVEEQVSRAEARARRADLETCMTPCRDDTGKSRPTPCPAKPVEIS